MCNNTIIKDNNEIFVIKILHNILNYKAIKFTITNKYF